MTGRAPFHARRYSVDGLVHQYPATEFEPPLQPVVTPLHADTHLNPDDHDRRDVSDIVLDLAGVDLCQPCNTVARIRAQTMAVRRSRDETGPPELDGPHASAGAKSGTPAEAPTRRR
ncbi:hypothetical protein [Amycolatopsis pigmentata]|uniref:Uncharacterized protein n=1 Tax=Amycolatopsis pigmentata TaxID=450801 RepID=A0ABW5G428_9PSEU